MDSLQNEWDFDKKSGLFLSALVNNEKDSVYQIHTSYLEKLPRHLGFQNHREIIVFGDVGEHIADQMCGGSIAVNGNVLHIIGSGMHDGEIHITGEIIPCEWTGETFGKNIHRGRIYQNGELIFDKDQ